ncbi:MAG: hypothetical protein ACI4RJ_03630 [Alphaproteobacteria bacterium]
MISKGSFIGIGLGAVMLAMVPVQSMAMVHVISDIPQKLSVFADYIQMAKALKTSMETYKQMQDTYATIGGLKKMANKLKDEINDTLKKEAAKFGESYISDNLKKIGMEEAQKEASKVRKLVKDNLVSATKDLPLQDAVKRAVLRQDAKEDAVSDAMATAMAYLSESTKAPEEKLAPAKKTVEQKETLKDKLDGANEVSVAILRELMEGNRLTAIQLRLMSASELANMPVYKDEES